LAGLPHARADAAPSAYVTNAFETTVSVIDTATDTVTATIPVCASPGGVAITPDGAFAYVTCSVSRDVNFVAVIDTKTNIVVAQVTVERNPTNVAITPDGSRAYVTNALSNSVSVIDTQTLTVIRHVPLPSPYAQSPDQIAITPDGAYAYVSHLWLDPSSEKITSRIAVIEIATDTFIASIDVGLIATGIAITPDGTRAYVPTRDPKAVWVIDVKRHRVITTIDLPPIASFDPAEQYPFGIAISPDGAQAYVVINANALAVIDTATNRVVKMTRVDNWPFGIALTPDGGRAYVTTLQSNIVAAVDTQTLAVVATIHVGRAPSGIAITPVP